MSKAGLRFECTGCGKCCVYRDEYAHVYLNRTERKALADHLGVSLRTFKHRYTFVDEFGWTQLKTVRDRCVFLDPDTMACKVYGARPVQCRTFPFWDELIEGGEWTQQARDLCEGVGRGRLYTLEEAFARIVERESSSEE